MTIDRATPMTTDLKTIKARAQATAGTCPELLVTVPAGVMVELLRDVERYRWLRDKQIPLDGHDFLSTQEILDRRIDAAIAREAQ